MITMDSVLTLQFAICAEVVQAVQRSEISL